MLEITHVLIAIPLLLDTSPSPLRIRRRRPFLEKGLKLDSDMVVWLDGCGAPGGSEQVTRCRKTGE